MLLDDDTRQMLRDCQEYLLGALEEGEGTRMENLEVGTRSVSAEHSPVR